MVRLGDVCRTTSGGTPSRSRQDFFGGNIPWVKSGDLNDSIVRKVDEYLTELGLQTSSAKKFPPGTLLIAMYGATVGKLGILGMEAATNQAVCGIQPTEQIDRNFLFYFLLSRRVALVAKSIGGAQPNISQAIIRDLTVPLLPLEEQRRIVGLLDRAAEIRRRADVARAKARAILPALFLDMFGDPATNPKEWPLAKLGELLDRIDGGWSPVCGDGAPMPGEWGVLKLSAVKSSGFVGSEAKRLPEAVVPREDLEVSEGDLLFTRKNTMELVGTSAVADTSGRKRMLPDTIFRLVPSDPKHFVPRYLSALINMPSFRPAIRKLASGSASSMPGISKGRLSGFEIPVPPMSLQTAFSEQAQRLEATARALDAAVAKAEAMAAALSAEVFG